MAWSCPRCYEAGTTKEQLKSSSSSDVLEGSVMPAEDVNGIEVSADMEVLAREGNVIQAATSGDGLSITAHLEALHKVN